jgi:hypothetical protein
MSASRASPALDTLLLIDDLAVDRDAAFLRQRKSVIVICNWSGSVLECKLMSKTCARQLGNNPKNRQIYPQGCRELTANAGVFCRGSRADYNASEMPSFIASPRLM